MKKIFIRVAIALFVLIISITGCKKDEPTLPENTPSLNPTAEFITIDDNSKDLIVNDSIIPNDFNKIYAVELIGFDKSKITKGTVIVDYRKAGNLWVVNEVKPGKTDGSFLIDAYQATLDVLFHNTTIEASTPTNRTKDASSNSAKLESGRFRMYGGDEEYDFAIDYGTISIEDIVEENGINISIINNTLTVGFTNFEIYSNNSNTFNVTIPDGKVELNNAIDLKMKYSPIIGAVLGVAGTVGSMKDFECSVYSDVDTDLKLNFQSTTNGPLNLIDPIEIEIGSYTKIIPAPPLIFSARVRLKAKLTFTTDADFNITPHIELKNNYENSISYKGLTTVPTFNSDYTNVQKKLNTSVEGDFNLTQRFEIIPELDVYLYGSIGPSGEIICYEQFEANAHIDNALTTWDASLDVGLDYTAAFNVSLLHIDELTTSLFDIDGNLFNYNLYKAPLNLEIVSGNNQNGTANNQLAQPIVLKVTDKLNNALSLVPVFIETSDGSFTNQYFYTDINGLIEVDWTLGANSSQTAQAYLKDGSNNVISNTNLTISATTGTGGNNPPVADFTADQISVTEGTTINFTDNSTNTPTSWSWSFPGGTPNTSTSQNPSITYNTAGTYDVILTATNVDGNDIETKTGYITVTSCIGGIYTGNITLTSQTEIDNFGLNCYSEITGDLVIDEDNSNQTITSLLPLSSLTNIGGDLKINTNQILTSIDGLQNIMSIGVNSLDPIFGNELSIIDNPNLLSLNEINSITSFPSIIKIQNNPLITNLDVFLGLTSIRGSLDISSNTNLQNINGFSSVVSIGAGPSGYSGYGGGLSINSNNALQNIDGLINVTNIKNSISISNNPTITNLNGLSNLINTRGFSINNNDALVNLSSLSNYNNYIESINISDNDLLINLNGLQNISSIGYALQIRDNQNLTSLDGIEFTSIGGALIIENNNSLTNLDDLSNLTGINTTFGGQGADLKIMNNDALVNLNGLSNISSLYSGGDLFIENNTSLTDLCGLTTMISALSTSDYNVIGNSYNPTYSDIQAGNCN